MGKASTKAKKRAVAEVEEVEDEDLETTTADEELEDLDDDEEETDDLEDLEDADEADDEDEEPAPTKTKGKAKTTKAATKQTEGSGFGSAWLAEHVSQETGKTYDARAIRMLLRKAAKDGTLAREVGSDRNRYDFPKGAADPVVKAVVAMAKSGEIEATRKAGLEQAKASKAAKKAAKAEATEVEETDEDEAPAPTKKKAKAKAATAAPAKAQPTKRKKARASE